MVLWLPQLNVQLGSLRRLSGLLFCLGWHRCLTLMLFEKTVAWVPLLFGKGAARSLSGKADIPKIADD